MSLSKATAAKAASWTELARKVGESEDNRGAVIAQLRKIPNLQSKLEKAIYSKDRPLALDTISALGLREFIPDLLLHVPADPDGFLTVAINSMMDSKNQDLILKSYVQNVSSGSSSSAAVVAMLEPLGRLKTVLPRKVLEQLASSSSPEVRSSVIYYLRIMALRNHAFENLDLLAQMTKAPEFQLRLQSVAISSEILASSVGVTRKGLPTRDDLRSTCSNEKTGSVRSACLSFIAVVPRAPASLAPQCKAMEKSIYSHDAVKIRMIFGYKDARPARFVGDRHERLAFIERVTSVCAPQPKDVLGSAKKISNGDVCGFTRSRENADLFLKKIRVHGKEKRVLLWAVNSSVGTDDQENREDPFQRWKSKYAEEAFTGGMRDADVVMYNGHSRFGGGPDFESPKLAANGTVDPSAYQTKRLGLEKMLDGLKVRNPRIGLLGLFSCSSSQHFNDQIHQVSKAGIVSSKVLMYYSDALRQSLTTLGDVLSARCPRDTSFKKAS